MINDVRLLDYVKDYEMEEFKKNNCNVNKKVTKPISLREMKNNSVNKGVDKTPINLNDFKNDLNINSKFNFKLFFIFSILSTSINYFSGFFFCF